jgi:hypothetical protein
VDWRNYFTTLFNANPGVPIVLEIISNSIRQVPYLDAKFWGAYPTLKASELMPFLTLAKQGVQRKESPLPAERDGMTPMQLFQLEQLEKSLAFCKSLGLGMKRRS